MQSLRELLPRYLGGQVSEVKLGPGAYRLNQTAFVPGLSYGRQNYDSVDLLVTVSEPDLTSDKITGGPSIPGQTFPPVCH